MFYQLKNSVLARNTLWMFLGHGTRVFIQAAYFVVIARSLGAEGYGTFVGVAALMSILAPFSGLGAGNLLIKHVSTDPNSFGYHWGKALLMTLLFGATLLGLALVASIYVLPSSIPLSLIFVVGVAEMILAQILYISAQAYQAFERMGRTAQLHALLSLSRLVAALGLVVLGTPPTPSVWGVLYLLSTAASALVGIALVHRELGPPRLVLASLTVELKEGFYFAVGLSADKTYNDVDKTMLAKLSTLEAAGIYAAAYRIIDVSFTPVRSLFYAAYVRFFLHGAQGIRSSFGFAIRLLPLTGAYALFVGIVLYVTAPLLPYLLGADYEEAVEAIRWLSVLPFIKAMHFFAADTLTGAGFQGLRSAVQLLVGGFNILINFLLIPAYSWRGAAWASIASDTLLLLGLWAMVWHLYKKESLKQGNNLSDG